MVQEWVVIKFKKKKRMSGYRPIYTFLYSFLGSTSALPSIDIYKDLFLLFVEHRFSCFHGSESDNCISPFYVDNRTSYFMIQVLFSVMWDWLFLITGLKNPLKHFISPVFFFLASFYFSCIIIETRWFLVLMHKNKYLQTNQIIKL